VKIRKIIISLVSLSLFVSTIFISPSVQAVGSVYVRGYTKSNGTYVAPHYRSAPDGNPYNNWSYPGNTNPYTGNTAPGNPQTYLNNYCDNSPNNAYCGGSVFSSAPVILKQGEVVKTSIGNTIYLIQNNNRYAFPNMKMFSNFGFKPSQIKTVSAQSLTLYAEVVASYGPGNLVKADDSQAVWRITYDPNNQATSKSLVNSMDDLKKCGYNASQIKEIYPYELDRLSLATNNTYWPVCK
jgi:hypothetical protein